MTKTTPLLAAALALTGAAHAQDTGMDHDAGHQHEHRHEHQQDHEGAEAAPAPAVRPADAPARTITVRVDGMVCDFCARSLTKVLRRDGNVADVAISLEDKTVTILLAEGGAMDDAAVTEAVLSAGYNVAAIERGAS